MAVVNCGACNFAHITPYGVLTCHFNAPMVLPLDSQAHWPQVQSSDWCGQGQSGTPVKAEEKQNG